MITAEFDFNTVIRGIRGKRTVENFIKTAFEAVGNVMYIYGGGWNETDEGPGINSMTLGLSKGIVEFANKQTSLYNYKDYDYNTDISVINKGFDCSAYVGWVIYNVLNDGKGYVTNSYKMGHMLKDMGYGTLISKENVCEHKPGDIMCSNSNKCRHIYISLGECSDKSELLLHSSPPGVQISGTYTPLGNKNSEAVKLAEKYMKKYYSKWYKRFPENSRDTLYLTEYDRFKWSYLSDNEGYGNMCPSEVMENVFSEVNN